VQDADAFAIVDLERVEAGLQPGDLGDALTERGFELGHPRA
jgi:hypothetical protein